MLLLSLLPEITLDLARDLTGSAAARNILVRLYQRQLLVTRGDTAGGSQHLHAPRAHTSRPPVSAAASRPSRRYRAERLSPARPPARFPLQPAHRAFRAARARGPSRECRGVPARRRISGRGERSR